MTMLKNVQAVYTVITRHTNTMCAIGQSQPDHVVRGIKDVGLHILVPCVVLLVSAYRLRLKVVPVDGPESVIYSVEE